MGLVFLPMWKKALGESMAIHETVDMNALAFLASTNTTRGPPVLLPASAFPGVSSLAPLEIQETLQ